jgi:hypothetical protein
LSSITDPLDLDAQTFDGEQRITTLRHSRIRVVTAFPAPKDLIDLYYTFKGAGA